MPQTLTCHCGAVFTQQRYGQKYCRVECRPPRPGTRTAGRVAASRRRRLRAATTWDGVADAEILERDRWMCGICRKRIGRKFRYPHPRSASVDHLLPLSLGGDDTALNKRAAHLGCNVTRGNGRAGEQMPLPFGIEDAGAPMPRLRIVRPRPAPRPCAVCGELTVGAGCRLHARVYFGTCSYCGCLFASRTASRRSCYDDECKAARLQKPRVSPEEARERKRKKDRERMQQLRATEEGRERIAAIKLGHAVRQAQRSVVAQEGHRGRFGRNEAAPVQGAQVRGSQPVRQPVLNGHDYAASPQRLAEAAT